MELWMVIGIVALGLLLILVEIFLIPGTTVFGVIGGLIMVAGIVQAYNINVQTGHIFLGISSLLSIGLLMAALKVAQSRKYAMNEVISGKVNVLDQEIAAVGDEGRTISILRPNGKALIKGKKTEVYSSGEYIEVDEAIRVIEITSDKIYVEKI